ncbi:MAG: hypothetical protein ACYCYM_12015 [Saccharofermentanales bacterium]
MKEMAINSTLISKIFNTVMLLVLFILFIISDNRIYFHYVDAVFHGDGPSIFEGFMLTNFLIFSLIYGIISGLIMIMLLCLTKKYSKWLFFTGSLFLLFFLNVATFGYQSDLETILSAYAGGLTAIFIIVLYELVLFIRKPLIERNGKT